MAVPIVDISLPKGNTKTWTLTVSQDGSPVNLGNDAGDGTPALDAYLWFTAKSKANDPESAALIKLSTADGHIVPMDQTTNKGQATVRIPRDLTLTMDAPKQMVYDIQMRWGPGPDYEYTTVVKGDLTLEATVTTRTTTTGS